MDRATAMREAADRSILAPASDGLAPIATAGADAERARICEWLREPFGGDYGWSFRLQMIWCALFHPHRIHRHAWAVTADAIERGDHWPKGADDES